METWKRFGEKQVSHSMAHYLQAVASLKDEKGFVRVGDVVAGLRIKRIGGDQVVIVGMDTTWVLKVREPWK